MLPAETQAIEGGLIMGKAQPIATAPTDGRKVTVLWTDRDGQENETIAQYRSLDRLKLAGGDWDESDAGWWAYIDGDTQKRIEPHSWQSAPGDEDE
jgi:hypothetical protein